MKCDKFEKYELGELEETAFQEHKRSCYSCSNRIKEDIRLMSQVKDIKKPLEAPLLWEKIEIRLKREAQTHKRTVSVFKLENIFRYSAIAASLLIIIGLSLYLLSKRTTEYSGLLARSALEKIENREKGYMQAISELEKIVQPKMASMDIELMLLYKDRLETIDAQIVQCKEALAGNPANSHIRKYLLAALQDKKETLKEIVRFEQYGRL